MVPLHISSKTDKITGTPTPRRSTLPAEMPRDVDMPSTRSSSRTGSLDSPIVRSNNIGRVRKISGDNLPKKKLHQKTRPSYCFSADARSLFLWAKDAEKIAIYDVTSGTPESFDAIDVHLAAGGEKLYAIVSETGNVILFLVPMTI